jgi:hypothetical protein
MSRPSTGMCQPEVRPIRRGEGVRKGALVGPLSEAAPGAVLPRGYASLMLMLPCSMFGIAGSGGHTMGLGCLDVKTRRYPSPLPPERPVSLTDERKKVPAGAVLDDDSVICPTIPAVFTPVASVTTWRHTT